MTQHLTPSSSHLTNHDNVSVLTLGDTINSASSTPLLASPNTNSADSIGTTKHSDNAPADPVLENECAVCLLPITVSTLARLTACPHVFHNECIRAWHNTRWKNGRTPNCPSCRVCGPLAPAWPSFEFYRSLIFGPSGILTLLPHIIVIRTQYTFSSNTKQIIRFVDIKRFLRKRNYIYLYDHSDELIYSFRPYQLSRFLQELIQNIKQYNPHIIPLLHIDGVDIPPNPGRTSLLP